MNEKTKQKKEKTQPDDEQSPDEAQNERSYYYDDAHGYEIYREEDDLDDEASKDENC